MANRPSSSCSGSSTAQISDYRGTCSAANGCAIEASRTSSSSSKEKKGSTRIQKEESNVLVVPIRSTAARWSALFRSGLVRGGGSRAASVSASSSAPAAGLPNTGRLALPEPFSESCVWKASPEAARCTARPYVRSTTHHRQQQQQQQHPAAPPQKVLASASSSATPALHSSPAAVAANAENTCFSSASAVALLDFPPAERAAVASCDSGTEAEAAAAAAAAAAAMAFLASSSAAVPLQLLTLLGALAGLSSSNLPTVRLSCGKPKKNDHVDRAVTPQRQERHTQQHGGRQLRELEDFVARHAATTSADTMSNSESPLHKRSTLSTAEADDIMANNNRSQEGAASEQSVAAAAAPAAAVARVRLADSSCRAASLLPGRRTAQSSSDAFSEKIEVDEEATPADRFSAALWRTVSCLPAVETLTRTHAKKNLLHVPLRQNVYAEHAFAAENRRRSEQRDARLVSGSIQGALAAVRAAMALQMSGSTACAAGSRKAPIARIAADNEGCYRSSDAVDDPQRVICLPCAARRHRYHKPSFSSPSHAFAAARFILPCPGRQLSSWGGRLLHLKVNAMGCLRREEGGEAVERRSGNIWACSSGNSANSCRTHSVEEGSAVTLLRERRDTCDGCAVEEVCCSCGWQHGSFRCLQRDWTCHAVYVHLGMLYTAADVAASATAAAAGKSQLHAQTAAAVSRAARSGRAEGADLTLSQALGSVMLKRALVSSFIGSVRTQLLLKQQQVQQAEQDLLTLHASCDSKPVLISKISKKKGPSPLSKTRTARAKQQQEEIVFQTLNARGDANGANRQVEGLQARYMRDQFDDEERGIEGVKQGHDEADKVDSVTVCCFDGIEQLDVCQWSQAVSVLNCVLPEIAAAAAMQIEQERQIRDIKGKIVSFESLGRSKSGSETSTDINNRPVLYTAEAWATAAGAHTAGPAATEPPCMHRVTMHTTRVLFLLLWKRGELDAEEPVDHLRTPAAAAKVSQKGLWEDVILWQEQVRREYFPFVQVLFLPDLDGEDLEAKAFSDMSLYLIRGSNVLRVNATTPATIAGVVSQQQQLYDRQSTEQPKMQHLPKRPPHNQETETQSQCRREQNERGQHHSQEDSLRLLQQEQQQQQTPPLRSVKKLPDMEHGVRANQHQQVAENDEPYAKMCGGAGTADVGPGTDRAKHNTHTGASTTDACMTIEVNESAVSESTAFESRRQRFHSRSDWPRQRDVRITQTKRLLRPCMLFLCGNSFMAAPLLSEGRSWRGMMSHFPKPLQKFVRELEERVYIPMMLRSRSVTCGALGVAPRRATGDAVAAAAQDKAAWLERQSERLLRWGGELFPPPRVLVHSCDIRGRRHCSSRGTLARDSDRTATVPLDGGLSPQQLLQLIGEKYSREVQTFLLPVAALASSFVGQTEEKLRRLLREAAAAAPAVLVLLGLDHLAARRRLHNLSTYKQHTVHTSEKPEQKQRPSNAMGNHHKKMKDQQVQQGDQARTAGPHHEREVFSTQTRLNYFSDRYSSAGGASGYEENTSQSTPSRRVVGRGRSSGYQQGEQVVHNTQTEYHVSELRTKGLPTHGEETPTAGRGDPTILRGDNGKESDASCAAERETTREESGEEESKFDSRRGSAATSSLRRRLLAALLVGLDDVEDRRSCRSYPLLSAEEDLCHVTATEETDNEVAAEIKLARQWQLQQAGLAVVGVCGGHPQWLDEAVVRAGRLDMWISWPQSSLEGRTSRQI